MKRLLLADLQCAFHAHLLNQPSQIAGEIGTGGRIDVDHRLHIYHHAYRARLLDNLQDAFEKTWAYLGDSAFESAALAFIESHPPTSRNLRWHGSEFPHWLAARFTEDEDIAELAMMDWQLRLAFDGPNAVPVAASALAGLTEQDWERIGFQFAPTLFMAPLRYNTIPIWHALDQEQAPPAAEALPAPTWLLIWRKGWQPQFRTIQASEHAALMQLQGGASFAQTCADLGEQFSDQEAASVAGETLGTWLLDEMIVGLTDTSA